MQDLKETKKTNSEKATRFLFPFICLLHCSEAWREPFRLSRSRSAWESLVWFPSVRFYTNRCYATRRLHTSAYESLTDLLTGWGVKKKNTSNLPATHARSSLSAQSRAPCGQQLHSVCFRLLPFPWQRPQWKLISTAVTLSVWQSHHSSAVLPVAVATTGVARGVQWHGRWAEDRQRTAGSHEDTHVREHLFYMCVCVHRNGKHGKETKTDRGKRVWRTHATHQVLVF